MKLIKQIKPNFKNHVSCADVCLSRHFETVITIHLNTKS